MRPSVIAVTVLTAISGFIAVSVVSLSADESEKLDYTRGVNAQDFIHGEPAVPSDPWTIAAGGRIYDNWFKALGKKEPKSTHPAYPASGKKAGSTTWRCKECHGWDFKGKDGVYRKGSHFIGIKGIDGAVGMPEEKIRAVIRGTLHGYTAEMISDRDLARIAAFVSRGQVDMSKYIDLDKRTVIAGNPERGRAVFQTVCAACHGFDGKLLDWGDGNEHAYVGTEAKAAPDEVLNKILNAHPGVAMANLRAFPIEYAVDVLSYTATLPAQ